ncbi:uncharacterized protein B0I36DRAFT_7708 [Microdochium trichocladiopsis]|uniref:Uncharacterized protein n=1 Tax=Microdochium trichocladiopsis TaxID=1682393 RepID=A0A9P8YJ10_9PEZI|nr:uncharacterized protein B0I36DRAFT_7708 [Microdochium trichocladiopsis]KAH7040261.1 hypothetical protein B0I36DRAFT_7708 [Microdochium trichocladiopsis]
MKGRNREEKKSTDQRQDGFINEKLEGNWQSAMLVGANMDQEGNGVYSLTKRREAVGTFRARWPREQQRRPAVRSSWNEEGRDPEISSWSHDGGFDYASWTVFPGRIHRGRKARRDPSQGRVRLWQEKQKSGSARGRDCIVPFFCPKARSSPSSLQAVAQIFIVGLRGRRRCLVH